MLASRSGVEKIVTMEDVNMLLEAYPGFYSWHYQVFWRVSKRRCIFHWGCHESPPASYIALWETISAANRAQREKIQLPSRTHSRRDARGNPILAAALRRDLVALQHLLDFSDTFCINALHETWGPLHRNRGWRRLIFCPPRVTVLDVVSWTINVEPCHCGESGLRLKAQDARIAAFLIARGAVRGPDYVYEALLVKVLLQHVVLPLVVLLLVGYYLYLSGSWVAVVLPQADEIREAAHNRTSAADRATRAAHDATPTDDEDTRRPISTMFTVHCAAAIVLPIIMFMQYAYCHPDHIRTLKDDRPSYAAKLWTALWAVLITGTVGNLIAISVLGTGSEAGRVFGANLLAFFSLEVLVACSAVLLGLFGLAIALIS